MANNRDNKLYIRESVMVSLRSFFPAHIIDRIFNNCTLSKTDTVEIKLGVIIYNLMGLGMIAVSVIDKELKAPFDWIFGTIGCLFALLKVWSYALDVFKKQREYNDYQKPIKGEIK